MGQFDQVWLQDPCHGAEELLPHHVWEGPDGLYLDWVKQDSSIPTYNCSQVIILWFDF